MNKILKSILLTAKDVALNVASNSIPGASIVISGVTKLLDNDNLNNSGAINELGEGVVIAIKSLKGDDITNAPLVAEGIQDLQTGFDKIRRGIR